MNMIDGLSRVRAAIEHQAVTIVCDTRFPCQLFCQNDHFSEEFGVSGLDIVDRGNGTPRNDNDVLRCLGIDILKCDKIGIFMDNRRRNFVVRDLFEECHKRVVRT